MNRLRSIKGNATLTVIIISMIILLFSLTLISVISSANMQARKQIERLQHFYNIKSELACIQGELENDYSYIHDNPTGILSAVGYTLITENYDEEIGVITNEETGIEELETISQEYTYNIDISGHTFVIKAKCNLIDLDTTVTMVK